MPRLLGVKLRHLRRFHRLTQTDVAQHLSLASHSHVSQLETSNKTPSLLLLLKIADLFGVTIDDLLRDAIQVEQMTPGSEVSAPDAQTHITQFGAKLRYLRTRGGWTQDHVSKNLELATQAHISLLESGRKEPSIDLLLKIADFFQVTTDYLLNDAIPVERVEKPEP
jgi:transcriptional regulator with XRE-family HTH domain